MRRRGGGASGRVKRTSSGALLLALALTAGCSARTKPPADAVIACDDQQDCPPGWSCRAALGRCLRDTGNSDTVPPLITDEPSVTPAQGVKA